MRDHCHVTGKYRGSAHNACYGLTNKIPVIFHNLRGNDSHRIMQEIWKFNKVINVIPNNMKKCRAFVIDRNVIFIDSFQFMSQSLSYLANNLSKDCFYHTKNEFGSNNIKLITKKGVYPYDYIDDFNKFKVEGLLSTEDFYSKLIGENVSEHDYNHAENVWKKI